MRRQHIWFLANICYSCRYIYFVLWLSLVDLVQVSLAEKTRDGKKSARDITCNTCYPGSLSGQDAVQSASFDKKPISNHIRRKKNNAKDRKRDYLRVSDTSLDDAR